MWHRTSKSIVVLGTILAIITVSTFFINEPNFRLPTLPVPPGFNTSESFTIPVISKRTFFFAETSNSSTLTARQACAVESVARLHPNDFVTIVHVSEYINQSEPLIKLLRNFTNVNLQPACLDKMMKDSPLEPWIKTRPWMKSPYNVSHLSDIMRSLLMWKFGGVYLDFDIVALRSMEELKNAIGLQSEDYLAAGVLIFDKGHPLINATIHELANNYRPDIWGYHGPDLYTRILKRSCNVTKLSEIKTKNCMNVNILSPPAFYPVFYPSWRKFFRTSDAGDTIIQWHNSYLIHIWNKLAEKESLILGSGQPYDLAAKYFCPGVYKLMKPYKKM